MGSKIALKSGLRLRRSTVQTTSSALKALPLWNSTSSRSVMRMVVSSTCSQSVARRGSKERSLFQRTSGSKVMWESWRMPPESCSWMSSETGSAS